MSPQKIKKILRVYIQDGSWQLQDSLAGKSKTSYIGVLGERKVFIKLGSSQDALVRLSEIEIAPTVLYSDADILIQEFIPGNHPTVDWVDTQHIKFAKIIKTYHSDKALKKLLTTKEATDYKSIFSKFISELEEWTLQADVFSSDQYAQAHLKKLLSNVPTNISDNPVPIHADPNLTNFILSENKIYIVDWDDIRLSDPMRDIGQFLYNFVSQDNWHSFFKEYGFDLTEDRIHRLFWWVASLKLFVALWFYLYQNDEETYRKYLQESIIIADEYFIV